MSIESDPGSWGFSFTSLQDWSRKVTLLPQPIDCKTKTYHDLVPPRFPARQAGFLLLLWVSLVNEDVNLGSDFSVVITLVLGFRWHSVENCSILTRWFALTWYFLLELFLACEKSCSTDKNSFNSLRIAFIWKFRLE